MLIVESTTNQTKDEYAESNKVVNGSDVSPSEVEILATPVPLMNALKISQAEGKEKTSEANKAKGNTDPAIQYPKIGSDYQTLHWSAPYTNQYTSANIHYDGPPGYDQLARLDALCKAGCDIYPAIKNDIIKSYQAPSWSAPQANQYSDLNIRYFGPIAIPPGYDESGAPLPVLDTPEVAHAKSLRLAALAKAGGDIYPAVHQAYLGLDNGDGTPWSGSAYFSDKSNYDGSSTLAVVNDKSKSTAPAINQDQAKSAPVGKGESPAVNDSSIIPNTYHGRASWLSTEANQIASAYNKYNGPIAIPPLPVFDIPDIAQVKARYNHIYAKTLANLVANGLYDQHAEEYNIW